MTINASTLRPGLLVSLKTSIDGNVKYNKRDIEREHRTKDGAARAKWETERTVHDPAEYDRAVKARSSARQLIRGVCAVSAFGLLCPETEAAALDKAVAEARKITDAFNAKAKLTRINLYIIAGRVAADDVEAVRAINSEVRDLLDTMAKGVKNLDVKAIRQAATDAKAIGSMLAPDAAARIQIAIENARKAARTIVKAGEQAAKEVDLSAVKRITEQRTAFLDLDGAAPVAAPKAKGRGIDLGGDAKPVRSSRKPAARAAEI